MDDEAGLKLKLSKCSFAQAKIKLLGQVVDKSGIAVDPSKVEVIRVAPIPTAATELKSFLGLAGYYRRFICTFADIAAVTPCGYIRKCQIEIDRRNARRL